jgi:hypothetical protein
MGIQWGDLSRQAQLWSLRWVQPEAWPLTPKGRQQFYLLE